MALTRLCGIVAVCLVCCAGAAAQQSEAAPDNTKANQADRSGSQPTADQAKNDSVDRDLMKRIRRSIMEDHSLSTYAHNVKIIAQDGKVTLRGPVRSSEEKDTVVRKAVEVAGAGNVTDDLTITGNEAKGTS